MKRFLAAKSPWGLGSSIIFSPSCLLETDRRIGAYRPPLVDLLKILASRLLNSKSKGRGM